VLHEFSDSADGWQPHGVIRDRSGNLYGLTAGGGGLNGGIVYRVAKDGTETILHNFGGTAGNDGANPVATLIEDRNGNFYGTTSAGGAYGYGTVFEITP
jgi:uncharacterized repeat protein (TIGR03803 family)